MRILVAPAGSRGDFQPLLALALGLKAAGHEVLVATSPNFQAEVRAFGLEGRPVGIDVQAYLKELDFEGTRLRGTYELLRIGRGLLGELIDEGITVARGFDAIVGGGAQIAGPTIAEVVGVPYIFVAYTPQALWSSRHPPFLLPVHGLPPVFNRGLWRLALGMVRGAFGGPLNARRRALGLAPIDDWYDHFFPRRRSILAADPELAPPAPDSELAHPPTGALHLPDERPLGSEVERFLGRGDPPVYIGFGSMPDKAPERTTRLFVAAARRAGRRLVLSRGWAGFGGGVPPPDGADGAEQLADDVLVIGSTSHAALFPRVAAVVHHGGAGTTGAALRAGRPQVVVPHLFDQFQWGRWVHAAGLGPPPIARGRLSVERLAAAIGAALATSGCRERADALGQRVRARDSTAAGVAAFEALVASSAGRRR